VRSVSVQGVAEPLGAVATFTVSGRRQRVIEEESLDGVTWEVVSETIVPQ
jgi:hypothetical protein